MHSDRFIYCEHNFLVSVNAKLKRSERQIFNIAEDLKLASDSSNVITEARVKENHLGWRLEVTDLQGISLENIAMQIGECVHNLRSSLDNLAYALARLKSDPPIDFKSIAFPVCVAKKAYEENWQKRLDKMFQPDVVAVITSIQPYGRAGDNGTPESDLLYLLHALNISDKHRVPNLVVFAQERIGFNGSFEYLTLEDAHADGAPNIQVNVDPIVPGMTLLDISTKYPVAKLNGSFCIQGRIMLEVEGVYYDSVEYLKMTRAYLLIVYSLFDVFFLNNRQ